jgi:hypothetical protein
MVALVREEAEDRVTAIEELLNCLSKLYFRAFGSSRLRPYERACIEAWRETLPEFKQRTLETQLSKFDLVQRQAGQMRSVFYSVSDPDLKAWKKEDFFQDGGAEDEKKVYEGRLSARVGDLTPAVDFAIFTHLGRISSIEFESEPGVLAKLKAGLKAKGLLRR